MANYYSGKTIWVTGASSGIGEQLVYALSSAGAFVIISARRESELERVKANCYSPNAVQIVTFDQSDVRTVEEAAQKILSMYPQIDILFNNGGISQRAEALETSLEIEREIFEINFFSTITLSKLVAKKMVENKKGHLVITSSLLGKWGFHTRSAYAASKHALHGYYDSLRMEVEKSGISITLVLPGFIATEISKNALDNSGKKTGEMDANQASGISASDCAKRILQGVASQKKEFGVGGKEILGLTVHRFFPAMFERILRKRSAK